MGRSAAWMERQQALLALAALAIGAAVGLLAPALAAPLELAITPVLGLMLFATFLGMPMAAIGEALRDRRFLVALLIVNFVLAPIVAFLLSRFVAHDQALLVGVLFVLLTPCIDYVIVFTGLAGGARERLLAATPVLMLGQLLLLPVYLGVMVGPSLVDAVELGPFVQAFLLLILLPLAAAALTQRAAEQWRPARAMRDAGAATVVPLLMLTLAVVVAAHIHGVGERLVELLLAVPVFVAFAVVMVLVGIAVARVARLAQPEGRALVFSGVTRNSLVVLPLVLALPAGWDLAPLVVVTQTLVELVLLVLLVRLIPRWVRTRSTGKSPAAQDAQER